MSFSEFQPTDESSAEKIEAYDGSDASEATSVAKEPTPNAEYFEVGGVKKGKQKEQLGETCALSVTAEHALPKKGDVVMGDEDDLTSKRKRALSKSMQVFLQVYSKL